MLPPSFELDDLVQIAQLEAWLAFQQYDAQRGVPFTSYAYRRVRGACLMSVRRRHWANATHSELEQTMFSILRDDPETLEAMIGQQELDAVLAAIGDLPRREQRAIRLHYEQGITWPVVAKRMKVSETTVFAIRSRAIDALRTKLLGPSE